MQQRLKNKLQLLPKTPGVYFHKNGQGEIIYVGKAAVLNNRVRQYFQKSRTRDIKTDALVAEIADTDWIEVETELDALFLEAEMIRRYMPRYNILLRDDKSMVYIRVDYNSDYPTVSTTRRPLDDGARYFGPFLSIGSVRQALRLLRRIFPFATKKANGAKRANLHYHLGLDPGLEEGKTSLKEYRANLRKLIAYIEGKRAAVIKELEKEMKKYAKSKQYEQAAQVRNQLFALKNLAKQVVFSDKEYLDISKDMALAELTDLLGLKTIPRRIEGYDISHQQGSDVVASMVVFTNGATNKGEYRKFKTRFNKNDDFYNMNETIMRRFGAKNVKLWGLPNLVLIDGGKGQLQAALKARDERNIDVPFIGLAKREEQIIIAKNNSKVILDKNKLGQLKGFVQENELFYVVSLPKTAHIIKLLQRIRDESHRFAISYHSTLKTKRQTASILDEIPGIGPKTKQKLLKKFGSVQGVKHAEPADLESILGASKATLLRKYL